MRIFGAAKARATMEIGSMTENSRRNCKPGKLNQEESPRSEETKEGKNEQHKNER
jgi:hypothetical protein